MGKDAQVGPGRKGMKRRWKIIIGVFVTLAVAFTVLHLPVAPVTIHVGPETTRITGPVNPDGTVNYFAAVQKRLSAGVTPENNAAPLFLKAIGPKMLPATITSQTLSELGLTLGEISANNFVEWEEFGRRPAARIAGPDLPPLRLSTDENGHDRYPISPHPSMDAWLELNREPLRLLEEAASRSRFYLPMISTENPPFVVCEAPKFLPMRYAIEMLMVRANVLAQRKQFDAAGHDVLRSHRLARLVGQGPSAVSVLLGDFLTSETVHTGLDIATDPDMSNAAARELLRGLVQLPPRPDEADRIDTIERYVCIDGVQVFYRAVRAGHSRFDFDSGGKPSNIDWNLVLRDVNEYWDLQMQAARSHGAARTTAIGQSKACPIAVPKFDSVDRFRPYLYWLGGWPCRAAQTRFYGRVFGGIFLANLAGHASRVERLGTSLELEKAVLALRVFRSDKGRWPQELKELVPEYLPAEPQDLLAARPLVYKPRADGFVLHSVGMNGNDENGKGDDRAIEFPLPPEPAGSTSKPAAKPSRR